MASLQVVRTQIKRLNQPAGVIRKDNNRDALGARTHSPQQFEPLHIREAQRKNDKALTQ
jgi:hypothetical protein